MENFSLKEAKELIEKYELLEISLQDINQKLEHNIAHTQHLQSQGVELDMVQIKQIINEVSTKEEKTSSILKFLIALNIGFLSGFLFALLYLD